MSLPRPAALFLAALAAAGCRGPSSSPDGSVKNFYSAIAAEDWSAMAELVTAKSQERLGGKERAAAAFSRQFAGWKSVDLTIDEALIDKGGKRATVRFTCYAKQIENYKLLEFDCSDTMGADLEEDGKWHVNLPGGRLSPM